MTNEQFPIQIHFLGPVTVPTHPGVSMAFSFGQELTVTEAVAQAGRDRHGVNPLLSLLDDEPGQRRAWGEVRVRRGPWPEGVERIQPGTWEWEAARVAALQVAHSEPDEDVARIKAAQAREKYGVPSGAKSRTIAVYGDHR